MTWHVKASRCRGYGILGSLGEITICGSHSNRCAIHAIDLDSILNVKEPVVHQPSGYIADLKRNNKLKYLLYYT